MDKADDKPMQDGTTHFGYRDVAVEEKERLVRGVFDSVATRYDLMNDLMSMGAHRLWKRFAVGLSGVRAGQQVLDLAGGTGDLAAALLRRVGEDGAVTLADINSAMLLQGRRKLLDAGLQFASGRLRWGRELVGHVAAFAFAPSASSFTRSHRWARSRPYSGWVVISPSASRGRSSGMSTISFTASQSFKVG